ncbi:MAG: hypothetical protein K0U72_04885 [Gammaproteobacteria bacterium]|nr:hypothetical protein [Gammaproteobacteria bacterium]
MNDESRIEEKLDVEGKMWQIKNIGMLLSHLDSNQQLDKSALNSVGQLIENLALRAIQDYSAEGRS